MHPLPRVNELDASFDSDRRAVYFQQAAYGVPIRMALISLLLHLHKNKSLHQFSGGFAKPEHPIYAQPIGTGLQCDNPNCITGDPAERQYAANKFYVIEDESPQHCRLRCVYCEKDVDEEAAAQFVVADTARKTFSPGLGALARAPGRQAQASRHLSRRGRRRRGGLCAARAAARKRAPARPISRVSDDHRPTIIEPPCHPIDWSLAPDYAAAFVFGYLCGSIPFGVLLTRLAGAPDIRTIGSGNIGATNVLRTGRKALAAATLARRHAQRHRRGRDRERRARPRCGDLRRARRLSRPSVSGLARL